MKLGPMTRKWLVTIIVAIVAALLIVWLYTAYAADEVEPEVPAQQDGAAILHPDGMARAAILRPDGVAGPRAPGPLHRAGISVPPAPA